MGTGPCGVGELGPTELSNRSYSLEWAEGQRREDRRKRKGGQCEELTFPET